MYTNKQKITKMYQKGYSIGYKGMSCGDIYIHLLYT